MCTVCVELGSFYSFAMSSFSSFSFGNSVNELFHLCSPGRYDPLQSDHSRSIGLITFAAAPRPLTSLFTPELSCASPANNSLAKRRE